MVVRSRHLVAQASERLLREGIKHSVFMANYESPEENSLISIASIDTLHARNLRPPAKLIVIDECHMATSSTYRIFLGAYQDAYVLGVTATPFTIKPLRHIAEKIVYPINMKDLINQGHLVDAKYYCPVTINLKGIKIDSKTRDYQTKQLLLVVDKKSLIGDIVKHWQRLSENRPTLCFAVSISHSKHIVDTFNEAGIPAEHCDADTSLEDRKAAIERLRIGQTKVISNVGIFCQGIDIPFLSCLVLARPTKSYNLFIQQLGRGTRPFENKNNFIVLDHAGNVPVHGFITDEREANIDGEKPLNNNGINPKICKVCFMAYVSAHCPECGDVPENEDIKKRILEIKEGELTELKAVDEIKIFIGELKSTARRNGFKRGWVYYKVKEKYGLEIANFYLPKRILPPWVMKKYIKS